MCFREDNLVSARNQTVGLRRDIFIFRRESKNIDEKNYVATHRLVFHLIQNNSNKTAKQPQKQRRVTAALINAFE